MRIAFYSPYLPNHTGGGEKYLFDCAAIAAEAGHDVFIAISCDQDLSVEEVQKIKATYEEFLDYSLENITFIATPLFTSTNFFKKLIWTSKFDCLYYQTDGSLFFSLARKNILHVQVPLPIKKSSVMERLKLANWSIKNTNSFFTKEQIEKHWQTKIDYVHQPYVALPPMEQKPAREKIILSVGRFFCQLHSKRQDVLVAFFKRLVKNNPSLLKDWQLVLVGKEEDVEFAKDVAASAAGFPITVIHDADRAKLLDFYQKASIYWHATGFGIDENLEPEKVEHFGISTLEAMAAGVVPLVINKGGQKEILGEDLKDLTWNDEIECLAKTLDLIKNEDKRKELSAKVEERSAHFSKNKFARILLTMLER